MTPEQMACAARAGLDAISPDVSRWHAHPDPVLRKSGDGINRHQRAVTGRATRR